MIKDLTNPPFQLKDVIGDQSLWFKGPDGKLYATQEGVNQAWEEMLRKKPLKKIDDKIPIDKEEQDKILTNEKGVPFHDIRLDELLARIRQLAGLTPAEILTLADFLKRLIDVSDLQSPAQSATAPNLPKINEYK